MKIYKTPLLLLCFIVIINLSFAQDAPPSYKDLVIENPEAEADMKVVSDYVNALVNNNMMEAENLLDDKYIGYGPAINDSITKQANIAEWKENHKIRTNEKIGFVSQTFRVSQGNLKGDWVSQWGTYSFTQDGKEIKVPYQLTARVSDGKINRSSIYFDNLAVVEALGYQLTPPKRE